jgi:phosphatidylserine decarboxylase
MVADGIYYAVALGAGGGLVSYLTRPLYGVPLFLVAAFCLYFFRDPNREVPGGPVAVSPADGKIVSIRPEGARRTRISVFMNIFDVHVNRAPISGEIADVHYTPGRFLVASREEASLQNEQNSVTIAGAAGPLVFTQVAGLIARRIVFHKKAGETVRAGERVGLIKFGSRVDVFLGPEWEIRVRQGMRVKAGSSILARLIDSGKEASHG